jgi:hypothetical protein
VADEAPKTSNVAYVAELAKGYRESSDKLRARADIAAKTLGGVATTLLAGVGIAKFADVFPFKGGGWAWLALAGMILGFLTMAAVIALFTYRLWRLNRPVVMASDPSRIDKLEQSEFALVDGVYGRFRLLNRVPSLRAYEARAHRLFRIADRLPPEKGGPLRSRAESMVAEVRATMALANLAVVRRRSSRAIGDNVSKAGYLAFILAALAFGLGSDYLASARSDEVALAKSCGEAHAAGASALPSACKDYVANEQLKKVDEIALAKSCGEAHGAGVTSLPTACEAYVSNKGSDEVALAKSCGEAQAAGATTLPEVCAQYVAESEKPAESGAASSRHESAQAVQELAAALVRCEDAAEREKLGFEACNSIFRALRGALRSR